MCGYSSSVYIYIYKIIEVGAKSVQGESHVRIHWLFSFDTKLFSY